MPTDTTALVIRDEPKTRNLPQHDVSETGKQSERRAAVTRLAYKSVAGSGCRSDAKPRGRNVQKLWTCAAVNPSVSACSETAEICSIIVRFKVVLTAIRPSVEKTSS